MVITEDVTELLQIWKQGDRSVEAPLFEILMPELRKIAVGLFRNESPGHTLQPTALVNEAFVKLVRAHRVDWQDRRHFLAVAARVMRRYLIDHARSRSSAMLIPIEQMLPEARAGRSELEMVLLIDRLLDELEGQSPQQRAVVDLKFLLGFTDLEAAEVLGLSLHTLQREWHRARKWLYQQLSETAWQTPAIKID